jgi:hypothetical protein
VLNPHAIAIIDWFVFKNMKVPFQGNQDTGFAISYHLIRGLSTVPGLKFIPNLY